MALERPHRLEMHGDVREDPYYWLRDDERQDPDVIAHLKVRVTWNVFRGSMGKGCYDKRQGPDVIAHLKVRAECCCAKKAAVVVCWTMSRTLMALRAGRASQVQWVDTACWTPYPAAGGGQVHQGCAGRHRGAAGGRTGHGETLFPGPLKQDCSRAKAAC